MSYNCSHKNDSKEYFCSYEDLQIHRLMLSDNPRMEAYKNAILSNECAFKGKVVMDVGAGTGVLSLFCALAGAKKVYAVEASSIASVASDVVKENDFSEVIEVIHQRVEDVCLPESVKVDVIVSEWMGFYLFHESMLDSVIVARDKFLKPSGKLFPDKAHLFAAPCSTPLSLSSQIQKDKDFWADVCGFQMTSVGNLIARERAKTPEVSTTVEKSDLLCNGTKLFSLDLSKVTVDELDDLEATKFVSVEKDGEYGGMCIWFECEFPYSDGDECHEEPKSRSLEPSPRTTGCEKTILSTSPSCPPTHWKQTLIIWPPETVATLALENNEVPVEDDSGEKKEGQQDVLADLSQKWLVEDGEVVGFRLGLKRDPACPRRYALQLEALDPIEEDHPVPCECGTARCTVIAAFLQQNELSSNSSFSTDGECDVDDT